MRAKSELLGMVLAVLTFFIVGNYFWTTANPGAAFVYGLIASGFAYYIGRGIGRRI